MKIKHGIFLHCSLGLNIHNDQNGIHRKGTNTRNRTSTTASIFDSSLGTAVFDRTLVLTGALVCSAGGLIVRGVEVDVIIS